jgi:K+/H+ antiporter YhaU regulatory subunit KhtT
MQSRDPVDQQAGVARRRAHRAQARLSAPMGITRPGADVPDDQRTDAAEPWWSQPRSREPEPAVEGDVDAPPVESRGVGMPWLGQTEPFLRALARSLEPLEDRLGRIAEVSRANHAELTRLAEETHEGLDTVAEALAEARSVVSSSADEVGVRADAAAEAAAEAGGATLAAVDRLVEQLRAFERSVQDRLGVGEATLASTAEAHRATVNSLSASLVAAVTEAEQRLGQLLEEQEERAGRLQARHRQAVEGKLSAAVEEVRRELGELERRTAAGATVIGDRAAAAVHKTEEALAGRQAAATQLLGTAVAKGDAELAEHVTRETEELEIRIAAAVSQAAEATGTQLATGADDILTRLDALREAAAALAPRDDVAVLQVRVDELATNLFELLARTRAELADAVSTGAADLREQHKQTADRLARQVDTSTRTLEQGLLRVERLGNLIEAMSTKRGFRELVESEERLREEQAAFVAGLGDSARRFESRLAELGTRADELGQMLERTARDTAALRQVPERASEQVAQTIGEASERLEHAVREAFTEGVATATGRLRQELEAGVPVQDVLRTLERLAGTQAELAAAHWDVTAAAGVVAEATGELRRRIEGWGTPRSQPRFASELAALDERVGTIEQRLAEDLAPAISKLVSEQVLEVLEQRDQERPRGRFRR